MAIALAQALIAASGSLANTHAKVSGCGMSRSPADPLSDVAQPLIPNTALAAIGNTMPKIIERR